ncbi:hypothetical protein HNQ62_000837 [Sulfurisphaera ohwakuensis]|uniref:Uncharacterized protein n=1 Tax=Sulfurisphaera ohwakuensis TaxID=69656 RepID=A0A7J9RQQ6_SULOH|nr:hypothetical protein [Sulfurisphaera ohwakuensis]
MIKESIIMNIYINITVQLYSAYQNNDNGIFSAFYRVIFI